MNKPLNPPSKDKVTHLDWAAHIGVIISFSGTVIVVVKLLAVAGWDQNTAFAILEKSGTGNVLIGTLLASMPTLITLTLIAYTPRIEGFIAGKNPAERGALRLLQVSVLTVIVHIVSMAYFFSITGTVAAYHLSAIMRRRKSNITTVRKRAGKYNGKDQSVTNLEATTVFAAIVIFTSLGSLSTPWMPAEEYNTQNENFTGYVLFDNNEDAYVLNQQSRDVMKINSTNLTGKLCAQGKSIATTPIATYFRTMRYEECPS